MAVGMGKEQKWKAMKTQVTTASTFKEKHGSRNGKKKWAQKATRKWKQRALKGCLHKKRTALGIVLPLSMLGTSWQRLLVSMIRRLVKKLDLPRISTNSLMQGD